MLTFSKGLSPGPGQLYEVCLLILNLKQQNGSLMCFYSLKFESNMSISKLFSCIEDPKAQTKILFLVKISFFYVRTATWLCYYCYYCIKSCWSLVKDFFTIQGTAGYWNVLY